MPAMCMNVARSGRRRFGDSQTDLALRMLSFANSRGFLGFSAEGSGFGCNFPIDSGDFRTVRPSCGTAAPKLLSGGWCWWAAVSSGSCPGLAAVAADGELLLWDCCCGACLLRNCCAGVACAAVRKLLWSCYCRCHHCAEVGCTPVRKLLCSCCRGSATV